MIKCHGWADVVQHFLPVDVEDRLDGGGKEMTEGSVMADLTSCQVDRKGEPYEGMIFESEAAARAYYDEYAGRAGFLTRVLSSRKSERDGSLISRGLGCRNILHVQKSGSLSNETGEKRRDGCTAMLLVKKESAGRWIVRKFVRETIIILCSSFFSISLSDILPLGTELLAVYNEDARQKDEKDKRIQELTAELRVKKRLSAAYREQLLILMKDVENHNDHLTSKVQIIRNNLKELEARRQELLNHNKTSS
ncbi:protein FAR1-RELATED SEQUENCE 5 [Sesamum angolense]|uniref:Protein FAR1-RELATED SEQUENCE 5 n=1 Tax=Sesamum angolense TaxID=2727404 RepID=A0AAE1T5J2_9LAMI|nr:protein FAR1-RELATED SEQUENCE 5 [Sesamum angolense]